ncbi:MAG: hypothetical protein ACI9MJ_001820 [Alphaproteobacteria bacterium]|jgi:hypothetical protein
MTDPAFILRGRRKQSDGKITEVTATFASPAQEPEDGCWYCAVECPGVLTSKKKIYGAYSDQATELAKMLILSQFEYYGIDIIDD